MLECSLCGGENPESARFCSACGASLEEQAAAPTRARKMVTVLFSDVVGSTTIGEHADPEAVRAVMARYEKKENLVSAAHARQRLRDLTPR